VVRRKTKAKTPPNAQEYQHPDSRLPLRPDVGTQAQFPRKKRKSPQTYRYDSSLSPALDWDGQNPAREEGEALIREILEASTLEAAKAAAEKLRALSKPFLNWAGKAERLSFDVPTLPLFVHERLSTKAIIETLKSHRKDQGYLQPSLFELFADPQHSITDQLLKCYEFQDKWTNRLILGDSLVVMNSLLHYENLGGQVQMIYMDPPYGVKFGSNFQPFLRKRDVKHNDDADMTREPEMVQAYRDTWELGLHSYLSYLRDRLLLCRELLHPSGSVFVQISDENVHHVREVMDEVFGVENFVAIISFQKTGQKSSGFIDSISDYIIWYSKDNIGEKIKFRKLYSRQIFKPWIHTDYKHILIENNQIRPITTQERIGEIPLPQNSRPFQTISLHSQDPSENTKIPLIINGVEYFCPKNRHWTVDPEKLYPLVDKGIIQIFGDTPRRISYFDEEIGNAINTIWSDTMGNANLYVVQTTEKVIQRCMLMTTDPGDLVLDPTCGSGTTAYVAEQWGRRWITTDVSRVPLALARQRLLTATFPYYELKEESRGPAGGFVYKRKQNRKGEEVGGIVPHITLKSIANDEPPQEEILVDRPETVNPIVRVCGAFTVEATIPTPMDWEETQTEKLQAPKEDYASFVDRMIEVLRHSPVLRLEGNRTITLQKIRPPAKTLSLSAEAMVMNGDEKPIAIVFGPENGAVSEKLVYEAAREAHGKSYHQLFVIGFAIQPNARKLVDQCEEAVGIKATYAQATPDLMMGDLLKNMRSSQIFSVCGLPEVKLVKVSNDQYQIELLGLDVFDPTTMEVDHCKGSDVPCWLLDTDYNNLCFHVCQAFFPRTGAWENLKKALKGSYEESVWDHLSGTVSAPFTAGEHGQIAVKVIDQRGNELLVVKEVHRGN
jgi:adenine-specific DNA-methyltransferase